MSKHNYSQYANKNRDGKSGAGAANEANKPKQTTTNAMPIEVKIGVEHKAAVVEPIEPVVITVPNTPIEAACPPKTVAGVVANCAKLNVRSKPSITGEIVCVLNASSEIEIDVEKSVTDWVYVCTATGVEGYCMRQFINSDM